jgi:hypothetical protein
VKEIGLKIDLGILAGKFSMDFCRGLPMRSGKGKASSLPYGFSA